MASATMRPTLSADAARRFVDAATAEATHRSVPVTIVVVDESGVVKERSRKRTAALIAAPSRNSP